MRENLAGSISRAAAVVRTATAPGRFVSGPTTFTSTVNPLSSALSQIANQSPNSKGGASKTMGSPMARDLERACGKPRGWMGTDPDLWPFAEIDLDCVQKLGKPARNRLKGARLLVSIQLGLEVKRIVA